MNWICARDNAFARRVNCDMMPQCVISLKIHQFQFHFLRFNLNQNPQSLRAKIQILFELIDFEENNTLCDAAA